jgi:threonine/homoserine/homoserine lactone efflux protein
MTLSAWLTFLTICCLGAMSPGPSVAVVLKQTVGNGRGHGFAASWFHAAGIFLWAFATVSGLAVVVESSEILFNAITLCGAAYLAWIGVKVLITGKEGPLDVGKASKVSIWQAGMEGGMISLLNPKIAIFFLALFSQFIEKDPSLTDQVIMVMTASLVDGLWYTFVAVTLSHGRVLKVLQKRSQVINQLTGIVFIILALSVVVP